MRLRVNPGASFWNGTVQTGAFLETECKVKILDRYALALGVKRWQPIKTIRN